MPVCQPNACQNYGDFVPTYNDPAMSSNLQLIAMDLYQNQEDGWITSSQTELILDGLNNEPTTPCPRPDSVDSYNGQSVQEMESAVLDDYLSLTDGSIGGDCPMLHDNRSRSPLDSCWSLETLPSMVVPRANPPPYTTLMPQTGPSQPMTSTLPNYHAATMPVQVAPEIGVSMAPVKQELRSKITERCLKKGLPLPSLDVKPPVFEMTAADEVRKERRRASNRKAAKKCRIRKLGEQKQLQQDFNKMAEENKFLRDELLRLRATNKDLEGKLDRHRKYCNMDTGSNGHH